MGGHLGYSFGMVIGAVENDTYSGGSRISRRGGAWTPEAVTFQKFCMSKRKNLDPWGGRAPGMPPRSANDILQPYFLPSAFDQMTILNDYPTFWHKIILSFWHAYQHNNLESLSLDYELVNISMYHTI